MMARTVSSRLLYHRMAERTAAADAANSPEVRQNWLQKIFNGYGESLAAPCFTPSGGATTTRCYPEHYHGDVKRRAAWATLRSPTGACGDSVVRLEVERGVSFRWASRKIPGDAFPS